jgi:hypothetical protein
VAISHDLQSKRSHQQGRTVVLQQEYTPLELPGDLRRNAMLNHLKWIAAAVLALGIVPAGSEQAAKQPETDDPVVQSLIEKERQWSESASSAEEIKVVQKIFADDFLGTDTDGKLYTKSEKLRRKELDQLPRARFCRPVLMMSRFASLAITLRYCTDASHLSGNRKRVRNTHDGWSGLTRG